MQIRNGRPFSRPRMWGASKSSDTLQVRLRLAPLSCWEGGCGGGRNRLELDQCDPTVPNWNQDSEVFRTRRGWLQYLGASQCYQAPGRVCFAQRTFPRATHGLPSHAFESKGRGAGGSKAGNPIRENDERRGLGVDVQSRSFC